MNEITVTLTASEWALVRVVLTNALNNGAGPFVESALVGITNQTVGA